MPMKILVLEDDEHEIKRIKSYINACSDFELVKTTNAVHEAIDCLRNNSIEGVIVDIELNKGLGGSGLDFLKMIKELDLDFKPLIIVTTKNESEAVHNACRAENVDMIYYKSKEDYTPKIIMNQFLILRPFMPKVKIKSTKSKIETDAEKHKRILELIYEEMNLIGIPPNLKGYTYLVDAIEYLLTNKNSDNSYYTSFLQEKYKVRKGGIITSIQDAINNAWRNTPEEDILEHFKANITYNRGAPTPVQFIHYYVDKISRRI